MGCLRPAAMGAQASYPHRQLLESNFRGVTARKLDESPGGPN